MGLGSSARHHGSPSLQDEDLHLCFTSSLKNCRPFLPGKPFSLDRTVTKAIVEKLESNAVKGRRWKSLLIPLLSNSRG